MATPVTGAAEPTASPVLTSMFDPDTGSIVVTLHGAAVRRSGTRLGVTSIVQLTPDDPRALVTRLASYHLFELDRFTADGSRATLRVRASGGTPRHACDGPVSAHLVHQDGGTRAIDVEPMTRLGGVRDSGDGEHGGTLPTLGAALLAAGATPTVPATPARTRAAGPVLPTPRRVEAGNPDGASPGVARLGAAPPLATGAWDAIAALDHRLHSSPTLLTDDPDTIGADVAPLDVACVLERGAFHPEGYRIEIDRDRALVTAADRAGFRNAFVTLAQWLPEGLPGVALVDDAPTWSWRGLHVDLARHWFEPDVVGRVLDLVAWRKLSRLHLHLTDDEAWRLPVDRLPELAGVGATRGHGLPLPPMLGDGPDPTGRCYTGAEIGRWAERADELGVVLVPEIELPAHCHAALTALPTLRDPDDRSLATSVQFFVDNVLVPGLPATDAFLDAVVDSVCDLFPDSPWIHIGGDEVADGAWRGSPLAERFRRSRGLGSTTGDIAAASGADVVRRVRARGRSVGAWEPAGVRPGDGYVVGWRSPRSARDLAAVGFDVVVAPGQAYYLDMAVDDRWTTPGASWTGSTSLADVCELVPDAGWTDSERERLLGIQACLWSEHVRDERQLHDRLFPRLDAVAERAWTGRIDGGPDSIARRSAALVARHTRTRP